MHVTPSKYASSSLNEIDLVTGVHTLYISGKAPVALSEGVQPSLLQSESIIGRPSRF